MANKIVGTKGDDVLKGTKKKDIIKGKGGNDVLIGKGGNDVLKGGKGKDELKGQSGNDDLKGCSGKDLLNGGKGSDYQWGGSGADIFKFKFGDGLYDGFPNSSIPGGSYDDIVFDYQDGIDKFDAPGAGIFSETVGNALIEDVNPVGGPGGGWGMAYLAPRPGSKAPFSCRVTMVLNLAKTTSSERH